MPRKAKALSLRAYARHRKAMGFAGGTLHAVQVAIDSGRLKNSLTREGQVADATAADTEWERTTKAEHVPSTGPTAAGMPPPDLQESRARREAAEAELAEIKLAEMKRALVPSKDVESKLVNVFAHCRTKLLGVPARARQRDPGLTGPQLELIEELLREALDDLASVSEGA